MIWLVDVGWSNGWRDDVWILRFAFRGAAAAQMLGHDRLSREAHRSSPSSFPISSPPPITQSCKAQLSSER